MNNLNMNNCSTRQKDDNSTYILMCQAEKWERMATYFIDPVNSQRALEYSIFYRNLARGK